jgi:hypothetical protein
MRQARHDKTFSLSDNTPRKRFALQIVRAATSQLSESAGCRSETKQGENAGVNLRLISFGAYPSSAVFGYQEDSFCLTNTSQKLLKIF